jgi:hypothetical protein
MASNSSAAIRWIVGFGSLALALLFFTLGARALQERDSISCFNKMISCFSTSFSLLTVSSSLREVSTFGGI